MIYVKCYQNTPSSFGGPCPCSLALRILALFGSMMPMFDKGICQEEPSNQPTIQSKPQTNTPYPHGSI